MSLHIAVIWQCFLPYHKARIVNLHKHLSGIGWRLSAIEVASRDGSYKFPSNVLYKGTDHICCFPDISYHALKAKEIHSRVFNILCKLQPDIVFTPATAFPEGMAAYSYRLLKSKTAVMMDDMWEGSDSKGIVTRTIKKLINKNIDAAFVPAPSHFEYYRQLGFPEERIISGVDVVDNEFFSTGADMVRAEEQTARNAAGLPENYFLFVGRFLPRKGLEQLLEAYCLYRDRKEASPWELVLVGDGKHLDEIKKRAEHIPGISFAGPRFGRDLCTYYGLARVLIVPSIIEPWGLVVNEALASGLPVIVSSGCGSAQALVHEGRNGWIFGTSDIHSLTGKMLLAAELSPEALGEMGTQSRQIISEWSLDRFSDGVKKAVEIPRRAPAGFMSNIITRLWKGRVRIN